jgi:signal transduction histidine kinase/GAF domain-containing protein
VFLAIRDNKTSIGTPVVEKLTHKIVLSISSPIHDSQNKVIGVLVGVTDLSVYNFISRMINSYTNKNGSIQIIFPHVKKSLTTSASLTTLKELENIPEKFLKGFEGFSFTHNELLTAKHVPIAGWIVLTRIPTMVAFEPLHHLQDWLFSRVIIIIILIGLFVWWIIKWQLNPLENATRTLATLSISDEEFELLKEGKKDEVGGLIKNFNQLLKKLKHRDSELKRLNHALHFRTSINSVMRAATNEIEFAQMACEIATTSEGYLMAWIGMLQHDEHKSIKPICFSGKEDGYFKSVNITWEDNEFGQGPTGTAVRENRAAFCQDFHLDPHLAPWRELGVERGYRSAIALPLIVDDQIIGTYTLYGNIPNTFSNDEVSLLMEVANDIAYGISSLKMKQYKNIASENLERKDLLLATRAKLLDCATKYSHKDFLKHALDEISLVLKSPIAFFHKVDHDQNSLTLQDWSKRTQEEFCKAEGTGTHYDIAMAGVWADSVRSGAPVIHNDYASLPNKKGMPAGHAHVERELTVPIFRSGKPAGILGVGNKATNYNENDVEVATYLSDVLLELYETKQAAADLESSREFNEVILKTIPFLIDIVDQNGNILFASEKMKEALKRDPTGERCWDIYKDDQKQCKDCPLNNKSLLKNINSIETEDAFDGRTLEIFHTSINYQGKDAMLEIFQDITEKKNIQAQLVQSDRMASMGMLAAGVAHEINNPLAYTLLNLEEAQEELSAGNAKDRIKDAIGGIERVSKIVHGIKAFSRPESLEISLFDVHRPIEAALNMAANIIKYKAKIIKEYNPSLVVLSNEGQLAQVFLNLIINAAHAIPDGDIENNFITIRSWKDNNFIYISFTDTGSGIDEKILEKIFNPFFTTKPSGVGSGLGLAISRKIIFEMGGEIYAHSSAPKGTTMTIKLNSSPIL